MCATNQWLASNDRSSEIVSLGATVSSCPCVSRMAYQALRRYVPAGGFSMENEPVAMVTRNSVGAELWLLIGFAFSRDWGDGGLE